VLEVTILRVIMFSQLSYTASPVLLIILWAIGVSMIVLAVLIYLPMRVLAGSSIAIMALHNLLAGIPAESFGHAAWIWNILYQRGVIVVPRNCVPTCVSGAALDRGDGRRILSHGV
jgi:uncharacterized membrane protein